jgi:hypothetical protein
VSCNDGRQISVKVKRVSTHLFLLSVCVHEPILAIDKLHGERVGNCLQLLEPFVPFVQAVNPPIQVDNVHGARQVLYINVPLKPRTCS